MESSIKVKGIFIKLTIDRIKKEHGQKAVEDLEKKYGKPLKFSAMADYPVSEEIAVAQIAGKIAYPNLDKNDLWYQIGQDDAKSFLESQIGKIGFTLFFPNLQKGIQNASKLFALVHQGIICEYSEDTNNLTLRIKNNPYHPMYYKGFFERVLTTLKFNSDIITKFNDNDCYYSVKI